MEEDTPGPLKTNKIRNIYSIGRGPRTSLSRHVKLAIIPFITYFVETVPFPFDKPKSEMWPSVSKAFAVFTEFLQHNISEFTNCAK